MKLFYWWCGICLSSLLILFFLMFGIHILAISFSLNNPLIFIATFFSSCLMILVCLSLIAGLIVKIVIRLKENSSNSKSTKE